MRGGRRRVHGTSRLVPSPRVLGRTLDATYAESIRRDISTVTWARFCANALYRYIGPFLAVVARGLDVSVAELGVALTISQVTGFAAPMIGHALDRVRRRTSMALGLGSRGSPSGC
jgi:predicted MFS family arabinose efflux permease